MKVSKRFATYGLNVSISVFVGFSVYGLLQYSDWGGIPRGADLSLPASVAISVLIAACIAGIVFFGHQVDLRNLAIHREEEARKAADAAKQVRRKSVKGG